MKILKFWADWCMPCKVYAKTFDKVSKNEKYKNIEFKSIDVENDDTDYTEKFSIRNLPTTIILNDKDEVVNRISGILTENNLEKMIDEAINEQ